LKFEEGRGPNFGYKFSITADEDESKLLRCHTKDSITINYLEQFDFGKDCQRDLVSIKNINLDEVQIFPNPFGEEISIQFKDNSLRTVEVYNLNGVNLSKRNTNLKTINLNMGELTTGIYMIRILSSDYIKTVKVMKVN
jgi:hypothetical protein